jgi:IPT/TIG domain
MSLEWINRHRVIYISFIILLGLLLAFVLAPRANAQVSGYIEYVYPFYGVQGQALEVEIVGAGTNFMQGFSFATFSGDGITVNNTWITDATHATASITIASGASLGPRDVNVISLLETPEPLVGGFEVHTPYIEYADPAFGFQRQTFDVEIVGQGTHFVDGVSTATFSCVGITVNNTTVIDATHATANITIASDAPLGWFNVTVVTGTETPDPFSFEVRSPYISSISPGFCFRDQTLDVEIYAQGTHFENGVSVAIFSGEGITVNSTTVYNFDHASTNITVAADAPIGPRDLTVVTGEENPDAGEIDVRKPFIEYVNPSSGFQGQTLDVEISGQGTHFVNGISQAVFGDGVTVNSTTAITSNQVLANITIDEGAAVGQREVNVITGSEAPDYLPWGFEVRTAPTKKIVVRWGSEPNNLDSHLTGPGAEGGRFHCYSGNPFVWDCAQLLQDDTDGNGPEETFIFGQSEGSYRFYVHDVDNMWSTSSNALSNSGATVEVYFGNTLQQTFEVPAGQDGTLWTVFEMQGNAITPINSMSYESHAHYIGTTHICSVSPVEGLVGQTMDVDIRGHETNFLDGISEAEFGEGIMVNSTTVSDPLHATANITIAPDAYFGGRDVNVITGSETPTMLWSGFAVIGPCIEGVFPSCAVQGQTLDVEIYGAYTHFVNGTSVATFTCADITVNSTTVTDPTHAVANITIAPDASVGSCEVNVITGDEIPQKNWFYIRLPYISYVTPSCGIVGQTLDVEIVGEGTHFVNGTSEATFSGDGITVNSTTVSDSTHATANITIDPAATRDLREVNVLTGSETPEPCDWGFQVRGPYIEWMDPNIGFLGETLDVEITAQGTHFVNGVSSATFTGEGITINSTNVIDATHATANITIAPDAPTGWCDVNVITGTETPEAATWAFVVSGPYIEGVYPNSGVRDQTLDVEITGRGTHFVNGTSAATFSGAGITVNSTTVADPAHATANITIAAGATTGWRDVNVITDGESPVEYQNGFEVRRMYVESMNPCYGSQGQTLDVEIAGRGTHFVNGTSAATFSGDGITVNSTTVADPTHATARITIDPEAPIGWSDVNVITGAETPDACQSGFEVKTRGAARIQSATPYSGCQGQTLNVVIVGEDTAFVAGTSVAAFSGDGITVNSTDVTDSIHAVANITIAPDAPSGWRDINVTTGPEVPEVLWSGFWVRGPYIESVDPTSGAPGQTLDVAIVGQDTLFVNGVSAADFGDDIIVNSTTVSDPNHATANITIDAAAPAGARDVNVVTGGEVPDALLGGFTVNAAPNPAPNITSISPTSKTAGDPGFTLTVNGTNFTSGSKVNWKGSEKTTIYMNAGQLTAVIDATDIATAGTAAVTVFNPAPGGGTSNSVDFTINNPVPVVMGLSQDSVIVGSPGFTLSIYGSGFVSTSKLSGSLLLPQSSIHCISPTRLDVDIPTEDLAYTFVHQIFVYNPTPGGGYSASFATFTIKNPYPTITTLNPDHATAGGGDFNLVLSGTGFNNNSVMRWDGSDRATTYDSATHELTAAIKSADIATAGTAAVTVFNPAPGGGTSNSVDFTINPAPNPAPNITSISPTSKTAGDPGFTLTVNGTNFISGSKVNWKGSEKTTIYMNAGQLTAAIDATDIATAGTAAVTVVNPGPGGGTSNSVDFTINPAPSQPTITLVIPTSGTRGQTLDVVISGYSTHFAQGTSVATFGSGITINALTVSSNISVTANISIDAAAATGARDVNVTTGAEVPTPLVGGFTVETVPNPLPSITALSPVVATVGGLAFPLTVYGNNFINDSKVYWNGTERATTYNSPTQLTGAVTLADLASACTAAITVVNPEPGGGTSNTVYFTVNPKPKPYISSLYPTSTTTGSYIYVKGSNFRGSRGSSYVKFGSTKVSTYYYWTSTKIKVKVPGGISRSSSVTVYVSGVGTSNAKTFKVKPKITTLSPTSAKRGKKVTIYGSAFGSKRYSGSYVKFGSKSVSTYYSWSNSKIVVKVPSAPYGKNYVRVTTTGGTSSGKTFTVKR